MASWQLARVSVFFNREPPWAIRTLKVLESVDWYPRGSSGELEKAGFLLWGPRAKDLPEPGDDLIFFVVAAIVSELGPIVPGKKKKSDERKKFNIKGTHISMSVIPPIKSSNSLSSKTAMRLLGMTSKKPSTKESNCSLTRPMIL